MNKTTKTDLKKLAEQLINLSVIEVNDLNQILKDDYGIEAMAAPVATAPSSSSDSESATGGEEKQQFSVLLKDAGEQKIAIIKAVKELLEMPLGEAKTLVEGTPATIKEAVAKAEAEEIKSELEKKGAVVDLV
ncbi:MAG: 50S ribosomal protein L7/L12 [Candidatus Saccharibacteria bacterium]|nr:50S ribosomal protein L7/L12 [Candidatus Saccharibacteria bacterium]